MATKQIAWTTGSGYITLTYNGLGNGTITVSSDDNTGVAREQIITIETTAGTPVVTKNITIRQEAYVPPILNFSYTGTVQSCTLPAGTYKLQCWGAQGGDSPADNTYNIASQVGGKGGYSEGTLVLTQETTVYIFVGGQPSTSSTNGGWNGGGGGSGTSTNGTPETATYGLGVSKVGRGGGATDIALATSTMSYSSYRTNRSSASLLSRFIVAGGGSGGGACLKRITATTTTWESIGTIDTSQASGTLNGHSWTRSYYQSGSNYYCRINFQEGENVFTDGDVLRVTLSGSFYNNTLYWTTGSTTSTIYSNTSNSVVEFAYTDCPGSDYYLRWQVRKSSAYYDGILTVEKKTTAPVTTDTYGSQTGYAGGGVEGKGYSSSSYDYYGKQDAAGNRGGFGLGANQVGTSYRYVSPCGGGGWYGGGNGYHDASDNSINQSGGGSGFVNTNANSSYRPQDYTGVEMDSGNTYDGNISNPSITDGTFETGHSGNGYARITRMGSWKAELPAGYTLVEYIENVSSAYINTGVNAANDIGIHIEYEDNYNYGSVSNYIVGARASSSSTILYAISGSSSGNTTTIIYNGTSVNLGITRTQGKKYVVDLQADSTGLDYRYVIDGSESKTGRITKTLSATSTPICLFGFNSSNIKKNTRISRCYITDGGDVVRYFLPCKNASNVVGLYDCVNEAFYGSSNSYTFTAGPNIN